MWFFNKAKTNADSDECSMDRRARASQESEPSYGEIFELAANAASFTFKLTSAVLGLLASKPEDQNVRRKARM